MPFASGIVWMIGSIGAMYWSYRYEIPLLKQREQECAGGTETPIRGDFLIARHERAALPALILCGLFSAGVGYAAQKFALSPVAYLKLLAAYLVLSGVAVVDWELLLIPNSFVVALVAARGVAFAAELILQKGEVGIQAINSLVALVAGLLLLLLLKKITRGGLGFGDIKLLSAFGFLCGVRAFCFVLTLSVSLSALASLPFLIARRAKNKDALPLGPFIYLGFGASVLLGAV